jgi:LacI family transcriptional regulator
VPRDQLGESAYLAWSAVNGRTPAVARVDAGRRRLMTAVHTLLDAGVDAIFAYCEEGPEIYLHLEEIGSVVPRDLQLLALCTTDCALNERLGVTHVCLHPERAPDEMFRAFDLGVVMDRVRDGVLTAPVELPWELVRGSTTR